jgi:hypothetical protein
MFVPYFIANNMLTIEMIELLVFIILRSLPSVVVDVAVKRWYAKVVMF